MIEFMPESNANVVGIKAGGRLTDADYKEVLIPRLEALFDAHGTLDLLILFDESFEGWDLEAAWDDLSLGLRHRADFRKLALVGAPRWVELTMRLSAFLMKGETRMFPADRRDEAWRWVRA